MSSSRALHLLTQLQAREVARRESQSERRVAPTKRQFEESLLDPTRASQCWLPAVLVRDVLKTLQDNISAAPEYQSVIDYVTLKNLKTEFDTAIRNDFDNRDAYFVSDDVHFGTVDTDSFNATIETIPNSGE